jgi:TPR repeat protein
MRVMPLHAGLQTFFDCCGKTICGGCDHQHKMKNEEQALPQTCAFCRTAAPKSDEEILVQVRKRVELKDPQALLDMAMSYGHGQYGLPVDQTKCIELLRQSAGFGFSGAQHQLGNFYNNGEMGLEQNEAEASKYYKEAAERHLCTS